jgi:hypothetical protein
MLHDEADGTLVAENGWRQGSILPPSLVRALISHHQIPAATIPCTASRSGWFGRLQTAWKRAALQREAAADFNPDSDRWMIISQDCDLVHADWSKEPYVELIRIRPAEGNRLPPAWLQSPREMLFSDPPGEKNSPQFVCSVHERVCIDRKYLVDSEPDQARELDKEHVKRICHWVARRYVRAAFPDTFNNRVKPALDSLAKHRSNPFSKQSDLMTGVYVRVTESELEAHEDYEVIIWAAMRPRDFDDEEKRQTAQESLDELEATLGSCGGIEIVECLLKSEQDITLDHLHSWKRWDFDVLSLRPKKKNDPLPPVDDLPPNP